MANALKFTLQYLLPLAAVIALSFACARAEVFHGVVYQVGRIHEALIMLSIPVAICTAVLLLMTRWLLGSPKTSANLRSLQMVWLWYAFIFAGSIFSAIPASTKINQFGGGAYEIIMMFSAFSLGVFSSVGLLFLLGGKLTNLAVAVAVMICGYMILGLLLLNLQPPT